MKLGGLLSLVLFSGMAHAQWAELRIASEMAMPARVDSNSPAYWREGRLYIVNSTGTSMVSSGQDLFSQSGGVEVRVDRSDHLPIWIESLWADSDGTLYGWYHHEPGGVCGSVALTTPKIGAAVSYDGGKTFYDQGLVLTSGDPPDCSAKNGFFAGGHGDFSVILDRAQNYFYFFFTNYGGDLGDQGVAVARLAFEDRKNPAGFVWKYFNGAWNEPGLGGRVTPVYPAAVSWQRADTNSFWGPSVHWNTYLETYVMLLSHACCKPNWPQEGIYVSFNNDPSAPIGWSKPQKILQDIVYGPGYYPQVVGTAVGETDTLAGQLARFWIHGKSRWEILFHKDDLPDPARSEPDNPMEVQP